jgi:hypothetical protein
LFDAGELHAPASKLQLRRRQRQPDDFQAGLACRGFRESAPATADFEHALAWPGVRRCRMRRYLASCAAAIEHGASLA